MKLLLSKTKIKWIKVPTKEMRDTGKQLDDRYGILL
jgi:hypothetical protein